MRRGLGFFGTERGRTVPSSFFTRLLLLVCAWGCFYATSAQAFILGNADSPPWLNTASGSRTGNGQPVTLTWSLVGDSTLTPGLGGSPRVGSDLIAFLDTIIGGSPSPPQESDLTARPWFTLFEQSFDRWEALSGIDFVYEANDDNASLGLFSGNSNVRGDIRIGGRDVDGANGTLAFAFLPNGFASDGDVVFDTSESAFFGNDNFNFRRFRNTLTHELGHSLNLQHVVSDTDTLLLAPSINLSIDGPQLDEVRAAHFFYGDVYEKSNNGLGNDIAARATNLGTIVAGSTVSIGADANVPNQRISATATDFVSISNIDDTDFFSFTITTPSLLDALLTPLGGTFSQTNEGPMPVPVPFDANARSNLALSIFDTDGITLLATIDNTGQGASETLENLNLLAAGEYFARVTGADDTIQLYQLDLSATPLAFLEADFDEDSDVDAADLATFESAFGLGAAGDANGDGVTNGADFLIWQRQFTGPGASGLVSSQAIPEPTSAVLMLFGLAMLVRRV